MWRREHFILEGQIDHLKSQFEDKSASGGIFPEKLTSWVHERAGLAITLS